MRFSSIVSVDWMKSMLSMGIERKPSWVAGFALAKGLIRGLTATLTWTYVERNSPTVMAQCLLGVCHSASLHNERDEVGNAFLSSQWKTRDHTRGINILRSQIWIIRFRHSAMKSHKKAERGQGASQVPYRPQWPPLNPSANTSRTSLKD